MVEPAHPALTGWDSVYVIIGSSGAGLIGLQFVVFALRPRTRIPYSSAVLGAFGTPTIMHLVGAVVVSVIMCAPWGSLIAVATALFSCGLVGLGYGVMVVRHARSQTTYTPVWQDWLWHVVLPNCTYLVIVLAAVNLNRSSWTSFVVAGSALSLLLIAIHNAWDSLAYVTESPSTDKWS